MDNLNNFEKTPYETNPVESPFDAVHAFVEAFDVLQTVLSEYDERDYKEFSDALRTALYRPIRPCGDDIPTISLYEIGVVYVPDKIGKYGINNKKLNSALNLRASDVSALFVQEDGILPSLCEMLTEFLHPPVIEEESEEAEFEINEFVYAAASRFLNECRRLTAMF